MKHTQSVIALSIGIGTAVLFSQTAIAASAQAEEGPRYEITITNLTRGSQMTPILAASHKEGVSLFDLGSPASGELATLAEEGNVTPLAEMLMANASVKNVVNSSGLTDPGKSVTLNVSAIGRFNHVSVAAMLIPSNDAFFAVNGMEAPRHRGETITYYSPAYDAGSEENNELCTSIPGPFFAECGGAGGDGKEGNGEGYTHIHAGMHGIGDFAAANRDWRNPVAKITIRRIQ